MNHKITILATDYDGTIAHHGTVSDTTHNALQRWGQSGRLLFLVTGRELPDLAKVCPFIGLFHCIVAENGALVHRPKTGETTQLAHSPPKTFADRLRERNVTPLSVGQVVVASLENNHSTILETIEALSLPLHVSLNKGSLMVLPDGINKAFGLESALKEFGFLPAQVAGVGDAENDYSFLALCGLSAAVHNALPELKQRVNKPLKGRHGTGVEELIDFLLQSDPETLAGE